MIGGSASWVIPDEQYAERAAQRDYEWNQRSAVLGGISVAEYQNRLGEGHTFVVPGDDATVEYFVQYISAEYADSIELTREDLNALLAGKAVIIEAGGDFGVAIRLASAS